MKPMKVCAHRGASGYAPENTLAAFRMAIDMKADGVELDVQLTKDGELVVIHDEIIDRVSNGSGWIKEYTLKELKAFNYNKMHPEYEFAEIPTLEEVYALFKDSELIINVELKTGIVFYEGIEEKILNLTNEMGMEDKVLYSSFNHYSVAKIKKLNPDAKIGLLYGDGNIGLVEYGRDMGAYSIHPAFNNIKYLGFVERCKKNRLQINVWNIRDDDIKFCCENEIDAVITNYPDRTRKIVNNYFRGEECEKN